MKKQKEPTLDALVAAMAGKERLSGAGDVTSVDRHKQHSRKIQRRLLRWAYSRSEDGQTWETLQDLTGQAANACLPCSSTTAGRWLHQFCQPGAPYRLVETEEDEYLIRRRPWNQIILPIRKELAKIGLEWYGRP